LLFCFTSMTHEEAVGYGGRSVLQVRPRLFVYPSDVLDRLRELPDAKAAEMCFGVNTSSGRWVTPPWILPNMLLHYITHWPGVGVTENAHDADLFIIALRAPRRGKSERAERLALCWHLWRTNLTVRYPFLNERTAARHVLVAWTAGDVMPSCVGVFHKRLGRPVTPLSLMLRLQGINHNLEVLRDPSRGDERRDCHPFCPSLWPGGSVPGATVRVMAPYPSQRHTLNHVPSLYAVPRRRHLVSYVGSLRGARGGKMGHAHVRRILWEQCKQAGEPLCAYRGGGRNRTMATTVKAMLEAYDLYGNSTFCLQPGGRTSFRKGIVDALVEGCIPVLLLPSTRDVRQFWPAHWSAEWRKRSSVLIDADRLLQKPVNIIDLLRKIPLPEVRSMQRTIQANIHRIIYLYSTPPGEAGGQTDHAMRLFLRALADHADAVGQRDGPSP
jgi:hypothetical protein